jgi:hypothetical protein
MTYPLLKLVHLIGLVLMGAGLIGVFLSDLRSRKLRALVLFAEAVRNIAVFYDGLVVPGALLLLGSGTWLVVDSYGGWGFVQIPWLAGMVALFAFEFIEGNTVTRLYFLNLRRLTKQAFAQGGVTPELEQARRTLTPTFTHFLDLPIFLLIVALGALRPGNWQLFFVGIVAALVVATFLTAVVPRLYPWSPATRDDMFVALASHQSGEDDARKQAHRNFQRSYDSPS